MIVQTKNGKISGVDAGSCQLFLGVPYAQAPVGALRFAPPSPVEPWEGVMACDTPTPLCFQGETRVQSPYYREFYDEDKYRLPMDEDCLRVDIRVPKGWEGQKLPVAFWIHGGAFMSGYSFEKEFDGNALCEEGLILVSVSYRCNIFGFFSCKELSAEQGTSGNYGILDQIAALKWVYENIEAFGGDPQCITAFGQSAGCMSVQTLVSSPLTRGMIRRAILQSGCGYHNDISRNRPQELAEKEGEAFLEKYNLTLTELRELPAAKVFELGNEYFAQLPKERLFLLYTPVLDGIVLTEGYDETLDMGLTHDIDYMLGSVEADLTCDPEQIASGEPSALYRACVNWALIQEKQGRTPNYVYFFKRHLPGEAPYAFQDMAFHSCELWYMFGTLDKCWRPMTEGDYALSKKMVRAWADFMKTGNPGWTPCTAADMHVEVLDVE